jgi:hypothetical protein
MATKEERLKILNMIQEGKITPEEGSELLEAMGSASSVPPEPPRPPMSASRLDYDKGSIPPEGQGRRPRWLRVRVTDNRTGRPKVNVRLPVSMVGVGLRMGTKFAPQVEGLDADQLMKIIETGEIGQIVDVYDDDESEHVEVFLE